MSDQPEAPRPLSRAEQLLAEQAEQAAQMARETETVLGQSLRRSDTLGHLGAALAKAQKSIAGASRDSVNPHFKSKFASLASVWDACRDALADNELAILQPVTARQRTVIITTLLVHASGEWIEERLPMIAAQDTPQAIGSTITYGRRYGLAAMVGVAPADDDGEAGSRTLPPGVKWDQARGPLQQPKPGIVSDEMVEDEGPGKALEAVAAGPSTGQVPAGVIPPASAAPVAAGTPAPPTRPLARPNMGTSAPPPPGMKPPARVPGSTTSPEKPQ